MEKLMTNIMKELRDIEEVGLCANNLGNALTLLKMRDLILRNEEFEEEAKEMSYRDYDRRYYRHEDRHERDRDNRSYGRRGRYMGDGFERYYDKIDQMLEALDDYCYGRTRYHDGGTSEHMVKGLEDLMYSVCTFVESLADSVESPADKEIIRKHIDKLKNI